MILSDYKGANLFDELVDEHGARSGSQDTAGSASIRPTGRSSMRPTWPRPWGAIIATLPPWAAVIGAEATARCGSPCMSKPN